MRTELSHSPVGLFIVALIGLGLTTFVAMALSYGSSKTRRK